LLRHILAGKPPDVILRLQYPPGMPLPGTLGDLRALTPEEEERLEQAIANINQTTVNAHHDDSLEQLAAEFLAARQDTVDLLHQFTDEQLATAVPSVVGDQTPADFFAGRAEHATEHMTAIEEGWRQGV
jgi:hypothetical protein